jgi:hypothetical protein
MCIFLKSKKAQTMNVTECSRGGYYHLISGAQDLPGTQNILEKHFKVFNRIVHVPIQNNAMRMQVFEFVLPLSASLSYV